MSLSRARKFAILEAAVSESPEFDREGMETLAGAMTIALSNGGEAIIDATDADILAPGPWWRLIRTTGETAAVVTRRNGDRILLHRLLAKPSHNLVVDHVNGNPLDNRRANLRVCTQAENCRNQKVSKNNTSGFKGVQYDATARGKKWKAVLGLNGKRLNLGRYRSPEEADAAYREAADRHFGAFVRAD